MAPKHHTRNLHSQIRAVQAYTCPNDKGIIQSKIAMNVSPTDASNAMVNGNRLVASMSILQYMETC